MTKNIKLGQTKVSVFQKNEKGQTQNVHRGIVIAANDSFVRVFNPDGQDRGGDVIPQASQWFAVNAPRSYCEFNGELRQPMIIPAGI
jgi:hypothetical protein